MIRGGFRTHCINENERWALQDCFEDGGHTAATVHGRISAKVLFADFFANPVHTGQSDHSFIYAHKDGERLLNVEVAKCSSDFIKGFASGKHAVSSF